MRNQKFIFIKLVEIIFIFFIILTVLFFLFRLAPGDPISKILDPMLTPEDTKHMIEQLGLDEPVHIQYFIYIKNFFMGNLGRSFHYGEPVSNIISSKLPCTILLFTTSTILAALAGVFLGKISAWKKGSGLDNFLSISALVCHTLFVPWFALLLLWILAYRGVRITNFSIGSPEGSRMSDACTILPWLSTGGFSQVYPAVSRTL